MLAAMGGAAPLLEMQGSRARLEQSFLHSAFCRSYGCKARPSQNGQLVFRLADGLELRLEVIGDTIQGIQAMLEPRQPLSAARLRVLRSLIRSATDQPLAFDVAANCASVSSIQHSAPLGFHLKASGRWGTVSCVEDRTGIPPGQEYSAPEWVPSFYLAVVLPL